MADTFKLDDQAKETLIKGIEREFPGRKYFQPKNHPNVFKLATVLGGDLDKSIHYEVTPDLYVELHLFENKDNDDDSFRKMLKEKTEGKYSDIEWSLWFKRENNKCRYNKVRNSVDEIIEGFKYLDSIFDGLIEEYLRDVVINECISLLKSNKNLILTGAPGTGKTYLAKQIVGQMIGTGDIENSEQYGFVQFHPSYDYTDFVEGLRPTKPDDNGNIGFKRQDGVFKSFCKNALRNFHVNGDDEGKADKFVFIIDEINRGDISKIFGELFFSIDPGYRGKDGRVQTQYQNMIDENDKDDRGEKDEFKDGFYVPKNVYIIGTMNDIDRSVESMDFAMRRRFSWREITAKATQYMLDDLSDGKKVKYALDCKLITIVKNRMDNLNKKMEEEEIGLNSAYHIGAAYFMKLANYDGELDERFGRLWENHLEGVLREYLRGDEDVEDRDGKEGKLTKLFKAFNVETPVSE